MADQRFQLAVMNNTEPRPSDVIAFENDLKARKVKVLIYNSQATDVAAQRCFEPLKTLRFGFDAEVLLRARRQGWT